MRTRRQSSVTQSGVTLVELMIVLVVLAVLVAAAYPIIGNFLQVAASKGAAEQVASGIRLARQFAITKGNSHCIDFSGTPNTQFLIREDSLPTDDVCDASVQNATSIGHGLAVLSPNNLSIRFSPLGTVANFPPGNPSVTLQVNTIPASCRMDVEVNLFGGVRVASGPGC